MSEKIPWHDPAFSARMLREHLSQEHGRASRRFADIDRQVAWIHESVLRSKPGRVLDLGCGPGLYTSRLARLGHTCTGIDFSPASIEYARAEAARDGLACTYELRDLERGAFGAGFDLALILFGELNTFERESARRLLGEAQRALSASGAVVVEVHPEAAVRARGERSPSWFTAERGLFSDSPHVCLMESAWDAQSRSSLERFFVLPQGARAIERYASRTYSYSDLEFDALLRAAGYSRIERPELPWTNDDLVLLIGRKE